MYGSQPQRSAGDSWASTTVVVPRPVSIAYSRVPSLAVNQKGCASTPEVSMHFAASERGGAGAADAAPGSATARAAASGSAADRLTDTSLVETITQLTTTEYAVLGLLAFGKRSGYDLARAADRSIVFIWTPSRSQIYKVLPRLVAGGLASSRAVEQQRRPDKALYRVTPAGMGVLRAWLDEIDEDPLGGSSVFLL